MGEQPQFHANKRYEYLQLPADYIRVLELQPSSSPAAPLEGRLIIQQIQDKPYEALSYMWGKPTVFRSVIQCQDGADEGSAGLIAIGANLDKALVAYRRSDVSRRLWVDAICIHQEDLSERQAQVRMMSDIFGCATQVLCWLGAFEDPAVDESTALLAIDFLREFNKDQHGHLRQIQAHLHGYDANEQDGQRLTLAWNAIKAFFDCDYFHRAWIIQEIGLARRAWLSWGFSEICIDWKEVAHFVLFLDDNGASVINHLELKSWVCNHINLVWSTDKAGKPVFDISGILHWARVHLSTDPRDFVYSLLGHPSAVVDGALIIEPNYSITTTEVYTNLAVNLIERTKSLRILAYVDHGEGPGLLDLPTWVPDWHALNLVAPLRYSSYAAPNEAEGIQIESVSGKVTVCCRGVVVDNICAYSEMVNPRELAVTDLAAEKAKKIPFLIDHLYDSLNLKADKVRQPPEYFINALSSTLTGAFRGVDEAASGAALLQQRADCAAYILEYEKIKEHGDPVGFVASLSAEEKSAVEAQASTGSAKQFVQDMTWTSMCRKVFRTIDGHIGLGPRILASGDLCVVAQGSVYPLILRKVEERYKLIGPVLLFGFMNHETEGAQWKGGSFVQDLRIC